MKALKDIILTEDLLSAYFLAQNPNSSKGTFTLKNLFQAFILLLDVQLLGMVPYFYLGYCRWTLSYHSVNLVHAKCETYLARRIDPAYLGTIDTQVSLPCLYYACKHLEMDTVFKLNQDKISGLKDDMCQGTPMQYMHICEYLYSVANREAKIFGKILTFHCLLESYLETRRA